ncbi:MAG: lipid-A-disaccharide synthase [Alphaproteobacteria bacterium]|nr:lipid-A-disaccharide synthase [Alphaproteobacteria bacterium]
MARIALIAGEASGDQLGGWLMAALKAKRPGTDFLGIGGPMMQAEGLDSLFSIRDINLIGIAEVLPHVFTITRRIRETVAFLEREQPDMLITIDSPGFVLRVLKQLRARGAVRFPCVHYVAPTVWAYRPKRAEIMAERFDYLLCLLPFEPPYFDAVHLPNRFIGHEIAWWWKSRGHGQAFRTKHAIAQEAPLLAVFPGSRNGEINRLWPIFKRSIARLHAVIPGLRVVIQVTPGLVERMRAETAGWEIAPIILANSEDKKDLFAAATAAMAKSGTIGLECALAGLPGIIAYRASALSAYLLRRMLTIRYANLANLLADRMIIPELLQENCTPEKISAALLPLLTEEPAREAQCRDMAAIATLLGVDDAQSPSEKAADIVLGLLDKQAARA